MPVKRLQSTAQCDVALSWRLVLESLLPVCCALGSQNVFGESWSRVLSVGTTRCHKALLFVSWSLGQVLVYYPCVDLVLVLLLPQSVYTRSLTPHNLSMPLLSVVGKACMLM